MTVPLPFPRLEGEFEPDSFEDHVQQNFDAVAQSKDMPWHYYPGDFPDGSFKDRLVKNLRVLAGGDWVLPWPVLAEKPDPDSFEDRAQQNMDALATAARSNG